MQMLILNFHIISATVLTLLTAVVIASAYRQSTTKAYRFMIGSFVATLASGTGLLFVGVGGIGRICASMSAVSLVVIAARHYYLARTAQISA